MKNIVNVLITVDRFFQKYHFTPDESDAIKMIHDKVETSHDKFRNAKGDKYLRDLAEAYEMICDFFKVKGIDVDSFFEAE